MTLSPQEAIGQAVRTLREHQGKSQDELDVSSYAVGRIERGESSDYSAETLQTVIEALGCKDVPELLTKAQPVRRWSDVTKQSDALRVELVGQAVRTLRTHQDKTQSELGIAPSIVSHIESGRRDLYSPDKLRTVIEALGCKDVPDLLAMAEPIQRWGGITRQSDAPIIGQAVQALRNHQGKSQKELGITPASVFFIELGHKDKYDDKAIHTVIEALGCKDLLDLLIKAEPIQRRAKITDLVGNAVRTLREHQGKSQDELDVSSYAVGRIERGESSDYSAETLQTVIEALGCKDVPELLTKAQPVRRWSDVTKQSDALRVELVGQAVRTLRTHQDKTQSELGIAPSIVSHIESGRRDLYSPDKLRTVIEALGCKDVPDLLAMAETLNEQGSPGRRTSRVIRRNLAEYSSAEEKGLVPGSARQK